MAKVYDNYADLITFTRASSGTALRRVKYGAELVTNGTFDSDVSGWSAVNSTLSLSSNALSVADVGQFSAAYQAISTEIGKTYRLSLDCVSKTGNNFVYGWGDAIPNGATYYASQDEVFQAVSGSYTLDFVAVSTTTYISVGSQGSDTAVYDNISVREVLFDQPDGTLTLFNHPTNVPRIEYDADGNRLGLLVEEARTNLLPYSEDFTDPYWTTTDASVTKKTGIIGPDGSENVYHFQENTATNQHQLKTNLTPAATQVFSVFAKGDGSGRYLKIYGYGLGGVSEAPVFDVDNGIVYEPPTQTHFLSASIQDVGNGWYRCSLIADTDAGTGNPAFALVNATDSHGVVGYTGDGTSGVYLFGAQLEAGSFPTSYIPTSGSTATRSADVASIGVDGFGYNKDKGTVLVEVDVTTDQSGGRIFNFDSGSDANMLAVFISGDYLKIYNRANSTTSVDNALNADKTNTKVGYSFKDSYFIGAQDGTLYATNTAAPDVANDINVLNIMRRRGSTDITTGHIKSLKYYPRALTADQIEALTS